MCMAVDDESSRSAWYLFMLHFIIIIIFEKCFYIVLVRSPPWRKKRRRNSKFMIEKHKCGHWKRDFPRRSNILSALVVKAYWIFPTWRQLPEDLTTLFRIIGSYPILVHRTDVTWLKFAITCFLSLCKLKCRIYRHHCDGSSSYISSIIIIVVVKHRLTP